MSVNRITQEGFKVTYHDKENIYRRMMHKPSGTYVDVKLSRSEKLTIQGSRAALSSIENKSGKGYSQANVKMVPIDRPRSSQTASRHHSASSKQQSNMFEPGTGRLLENIRDDGTTYKTLGSCNNPSCPNKRNVQSSSSGYHTASSQALVPPQCSRASSFHASAVPSSTHNANSLVPVQHGHGHRSHSSSCSQYRPQDGRNLVQCKNVATRGSSCSGSNCPARSACRSAAPSLEDDVFVDGNGHYVSRRQAPAAKKATLAEMLLQTRSSLSGLPSFSVFQTEYLDDYYKYKTSREHKLILRADCMSSIGTTNRSIIVDWLHKIQLTMEITESIYLTTVKLLDKILSEIDVIPEHYHLVTMASLWLVLKYNCSTEYYHASDILTVLNGDKYTVTEMIQLEREILAIMNYNLEIDQPLDYLYYWIQKLELGDDVLVIYASQYLLETIAYFREFSCNLPSLLAIGALHSALSRFKPNYLRVFHLYVKDYYTQKAIEESAELLQSRVLLAGHPQSLCQTAIRKYSAMEKMEVSQYFK